MAADDGTDLDDFDTATGPAPLDVARQIIDCLLEVAVGDLDGLLVGAGRGKSGNFFDDFVERPFLTTHSLGLFQFAVFVDIQDRFAIQSVADASFQRGAAPATLQATDIAHREPKRQTRDSFQDFGMDGVDGMPCRAEFGGLDGQRPQPNGRGFGVDDIDFAVGKLGLHGVSRQLAGVKCAGDARRKAQKQDVVVGFKAFPKDVFKLGWRDLGRKDFFGLCQPIKLFVRHIAPIGVVLVLLFRNRENHRDDTNVVLLHLLRREIRCGIGHNAITSFFFFQAYHLAF